MSNPNFKSERITADFLVIFQDALSKKTVYHFETGPRKRQFEKVQTVDPVNGKKVWSIWELK